MDGGTAAASAASNDTGSASATGVRQRRLGGRTSTAAAPTARGPVSTGSNAAGIASTATPTAPAPSQARMRVHNVPPQVPTMWTMARSVLLPVVVITLGTFVGAVLLGKAQTLAVAAIIATLTSALIVRFALQLSAVAAQHPQLRRVHRLTGERAAYVRTSQRLAMMDRDFTAADYEMLLDLDNNSTRLRRFLEGASQEYIDRLPTFLYQCEGNTDNNTKCEKKKKKQLLANAIHSADNLLSLGGASSESETSSLSIPSSSASRTPLAESASSSALQQQGDSHDDDDQDTDTPTITEGSNPELGGDSFKQCAICLEDFEYGQKIRVLPCFHRFKASCIDAWLLEQARCPICKCSVLG